METITDVIASISTLHTNYDKVSLFLEIWQDVDTRQKLYTILNLRLSWEMSRHAHHPEVYEEHRFLLRNVPEVLTLEAFCRNCGTYNYAIVHLVVYL